MRDRDLDEVADDLLDIAADIADLGELGRLDLEERRLREPRQAARDLGLAAAGRADHQDVLRQHLLAQLGGQLLAPPAVAQRDGDGALGVVLADDVAVELGDDLARAERMAIGPFRARLAASLQVSIGDLVVGVDADPGGDRHRPARDRLGVEPVAGRSARAPRPAHSRRPSRCR